MGQNVRALVLVRPSAFCLLVKTSLLRSQPADQVALPKFQNTHYLFFTYNVSSMNLIYIHFLHISSYIHINIYYCAKRRIFGPKRDENGEWRRLHYEELHSLYLSPNIVRVIKSRRLRWAEHVARMEEGRSAL